MWGEPDQPGRFGKGKSVGVRFSYFPELSVVFSFISLFEWQISYLLVHCPGACSCWELGGG